MAPSGSPADPAQQIRLTVSERARTVTYVATAATLSTVAEHGVEEARGAPFGTYVDYILDDKVIITLDCCLMLMSIQVTPYVVPRRLRSWAIWIGSMS